MNSVPFIYITKNVEELNKLIDQANTVGSAAKDIDFSSYLFGAKVENNFLSMECSLMGKNSFTLTLTLVDPGGEMSKYLTTQTEELNNTSTLPKFYTVFGMGSDLQNRTEVLELSLQNITYTIDKGRIYTITFVTNPSDKAALNTLGLYSSKAEASNQHHGKSRPFNSTFELVSDYGTRSGTKPYTIEAAIYDCLHSQARKVYNTPNTLVLLPDLTRYTTSIPISVLEPNNESFSAFSERVNSVGLDLSMSDLQRALTTYGGGVATDRRSTGSGPRPVDSLFGQLRERVSTTDGYDLQAAELEKARWEPAPPASAEDLKTFKENLKLETSISLETFIRNLNLVPNAPKISLYTFFENNAELKEEFVTSYGGTYLIGGSQSAETKAKYMDPDKPLVIIGDVDLIFKYLYKKERVIDHKKPSQDLLDYCFNEDNKKLDDIINNTITVNETLLPFFGDSADLGQAIPRSQSPSFSFGTKHSNIIRFDVEQNGAALLTVLDLFNNTFSKKEAKNLLELIKKGDSDLLFYLTQSISSYVKEQTDENYDNVVQHFDYLIEGGTDQEVASDAINALFTLASDTESFAEDDVFASAENLMQRLTNLMEAYAMVDRFQYSVTIKTLPMFLAGGPDYLFTDCFITVREPRLGLGKEDSVLDEKIYDGKYTVLGFRHVIDKNNVFSEFKLIRTPPKAIEKLIELEPPTDPAPAPAPTDDQSNLNDKFQYTGKAIL